MTVLAPNPSLPGLALIILAATCGAHPLRAQRLVVRVVAEDSTPVAGAAVDFWVKARKVLSVASRNDGLVITDGKTVRGLTSVGARAIGFRAASVPIAVKDTTVIRLDRVTPRLPDIVVEPMPRYDCHAEDREARAVWRTASSRYELPLDRGYQATGRGRHELAPLSLVSSPDAWDASEWVVSGHARTQSIRFVHDSGYAIRRRPGKRAGLDGVGGAGPWWYPRLHTWVADHFARPEFGDFNTVFMISAGPTGWTIGFCSKRPKRPGISGMMRIDSSYAFVRAEWEFITPRPREDAGGEVVFLAGTRSALLPLVSYFWRRTDKTEEDEAVYYREAFQGDQWTINLGEPRRSDASGGSR